MAGTADDGGADRAPPRIPASEPGEWNLYPQDGANERGRYIAGLATSLVGLPSISRLTQQAPDDCTGLVRILYWKVGVELMDGGAYPGENGVTAIYRRARTAGALHLRAPQPGDLAFFRETYDRNRDGLRNDGLTHVGLVESVKDGNVTFLHRVSRGVVRSQLNLRRPRVQRQNGTLLNDYLRRVEGGRRAYLTGELFAAYASADRLRW